MRDSCNIARDIMLTRVHKELCHIPMNIKNIYERNGCGIWMISEFRWNDLDKIRDSYKFCQQIKNWD